MAPPRIVDTPELAQSVLQQARSAGRAAIDVESNGMYVYRPRLCMVQLAWESAADGVQVALIDTLAVPPGLLADLARDANVTKVVHDLAFDARMLGRHGVPLAKVRDTSVAATYLGVTATGLASLLASELAIHIDKAMQTADWGKRPLDTTALGYLAGDVEHLLELHDKLWARVERAGIVDEVEAETTYRLDNALADSAASPPPWVRIRGAEGLDDMGRAVLRELADARETIAAERDVPLYLVVGDKQLVALAQARPRFEQGIRRVIATGRGARDAEVLRMIADAIARGTAAERLSEEQARWLHTDRLDPATIARRKKLDARLSQWRKAEASRRSVHEQVVLPSHCLKQIVALEPRDTSEIAAIAGMGVSRTSRYAALLAGIVTDVANGLA